MRIPEAFNMWLAHWGIEEPGMDCMMWQFGAYLIDGHEFDGNIFMRITAHHLKIYQIQTITEKI